VTHGRVSSGPIGGGIVVNKGGTLAMGDPRRI
jgi:hypothetical protein